MIVLIVGRALLTKQTLNMYWIGAVSSFTEVGIFLVILIGSM